MSFIESQPTKQRNAQANKPILLKLPLCAVSTKAGRSHKGILQTQLGWGSSGGVSDTLLSHLLSHFIPEQPVGATLARSSQTRSLRELWGLAWGDTARIGILIYSSLSPVLFSQVGSKTVTQTVSILGSQQSRLLPTQTCWFRPE